MRAMRDLPILLAVLLVGWVLGCPSEDPAPEDAGPDATGDADEVVSDADGDADEDTEEPPDPCLDSDGDGHGVNCTLDLDCDEGDAEIWTTCGGRDPCARMHVGCPCDEEGRVAACRTEGPIDTVDGDDLCYEGTRTCSGGVWSPCQDMTPTPYIEEDEASGSGNGPLRRPVLGGYERCPGRSCDQSCTTVHDCLSGPDLQPGDAENLVYDVRGVPAGVILRDVTENGIFRRTLDSACSPGEMATWWALSHDLVAEAPQRVAIRTRTAESESELGTAIWSRVVMCPEGPCSQPGHTDDRDFDEGNLARALGPEAAHRAWLEIEVTLSAGGGGESPRYVGHEVFFYCDPMD